ncbi:MAG TPA: hypothetical protein VMN78_11390, partial [Longimicrobiales bacterium]|nr:hypothetical protein [Longimicrobiales bacterium]
RIDLSAMVRRSVATLYSHLVTRPTGQALRLGIESQIGELGELCVSILDFSHVAIIDYSCADEIVAKLIRRYQSDDRPAEAFFIARGMGEAHREPVEDVLLRHGLALVVEDDDDDCILLGDVTGLERAAWQQIQKRGRLAPGAVAKAVGLEDDVVDLALVSLARKRVLVRGAAAGDYLSLRALLAEG